MIGVDPEFLASYSGGDGGWKDPRIGLALDLIEQAMIDAGCPRSERSVIASTLVAMDDDLAERERT